MEQQIIKKNSTQDWEWTRISQNIQIYQRNFPKESKVVE